MSTTKMVAAALHEAQTSLNRFASYAQNIDQINTFAEIIAETIRNGQKIIACGNGGSMCDAMHFAEELTGRFRDDRRSLPAIAISDPSYLTCVGNDYGFEKIFSRFVEGVGQAGDLFLGISTSGNSQNIINAVMSAQSKGMKTFCLLGKDGGNLKELCDLSIIAPGETADRIQEIHIKIIHIAIEVAEYLLETISVEK